MLKLMSLLEIGVKGGPPTYYIVKDSSKQRFVVSDIRVYEGLFYIYRSVSAKKAAHAMA